jgi:hypothetical protein
LYAILCVISLTIGSSVLTRLAHAQSPSDAPAENKPVVGLSVSPPTFELTANPGDKVSNKVQIENLHDYPVKIAIDRRNFTAIGEEGAVGLTEEETTFSLATWISIDPKEDTIAPHSTKVYSFTVDVPLMAEPGGHFGSIIFRTIPTAQVEGSGATVAQEIGSLILLRVSGNTKEEAAIDSFNASKSFYEYGPVNLEARIENKGNVHVKPTGTITITNMLGQKVATIPLDSKNVLPGAVRRLDNTWDTKWRFGRYTATLVMVYGKDQTQRATVTNFVVLPYKVAGVGLVVLLIFTYLLFRSRKRWSMAFKILFTGKS